MPSLTQDQLARLVRSQRRLVVSAVAATAGAVALIVLLIPAGVPAPLGAAIGAGIGALVLLPHRQVLSELGLSRQDAKVILEQEKERRSGGAALAPRVRADRALRRSRIYLVAGLVLAVVLIVAIGYAVNAGGKTVEEDAPGDPWFPISVFSALGALILAPTFLLLARQHKSNADTFRARAAEG